MAMTRGGGSGQGRGLPLNWAQSSGVDTEVGVGVKFLFALAFLGPLQGHRQDEGRAARAQGAGGDERGRVTPGG